MTRKPSIPASSRPASRRPPYFKPRPLVLLLANALLAPFAVQAQSTLPTGMTVVSGQASANQAGKQLTITNSANTILNWQSFSIGSGNTVQFVQPSSTSQVLNRVIGNDPSTLLGSLTSNGRVWLLNPNGVLFGQGARVDVGSLVASTLNLANEDWLAGHYHFESSGPAAAIDNRGNLQGSLGGRVVLVGGAVSNEGAIDAPGGQVLLAAGQSVDLVDTGAPNLSVHVNAAPGEVLNLGQLSADGGRIDVYGGAVNQQGIVRASSLGTGDGGTIVLAATGQLTLAGGSTTRADAASGTGGQVQLTGQLVALQDGSAVSANGATGGGVVLAGGGAQGQDASVPNSQALFFGRGASISADALVAGDGGHIVLWSDTATRAYGSLSAHAGAQSGNGGLVETSGGWLDARPLALDVSAAHGTAGQWLLDPYDITISDNVSDSGFDASFTATSDATISSATLTQALNNGTNVTVQTGGSAGTSAGDITVTGANIAVTAAGPGSLTLIADHDISMSNSTIESSGGAMAVSLLSGRSGLGSILITGSTIATAGGAIVLGGFGTYVDAAGTTHTGAAVNDPSDFYVNPGYGVAIYDTSVLDAGGGNVSIRGTSSTSGYSGVYLGDATISGHDIAIAGYQSLVPSSSSSSNSEDGASGAEIDATLQATHSIDIQGNSLSGEGVTMSGAVLSVAPVNVDTTAFLNVAGLSSGSANTSAGTDIFGSSLAVRNGAPLTITGTSNTTGSTGLLVSGGDSAIAMTLDASNGGGAITLSSPGTSLGMEIDDTSILGSAAGVAITVPGALNLSLSEVQITSTGPIALTAGTLDLEGVAIESDATGDAFVARSANGGISSLTLDTDTDLPASTFSTPNGRWIFWLTDLAARPSTLPDYDFQRFAVSGAADWSADAGNGLVYSQTESVFVTGTVATRTYDGTVAAQASNLVATPADAQVLQASVNSTAYAQFDDKNAGNRKTVSVYDSQQASPVSVTDDLQRPVYGTTVVSQLRGAITPRTLTGSFDADKVYDGSALYDVGVSGLVGLVGTETVQVSASGSFPSKNVGQNLAISASYQVADGGNGGLASNYSYSGPSSSQATITPRPLDLSGLLVANKVYDTTTTATAGGTAGVTPLSGDSVSVVGTPALAFSDKNVGTNKAVSVAGLSLSGTDAADYTLVTSGLFSASITPATLALGGLVAQSRVYDTTTAAGLGGTATVVPLGSDQVTVVAGQANFNDKNVGEGKPVTLTGFGLSGTDAGNYTLAVPTTLSANITPASISLAGLVAQDKVYDATTSATVAGTAIVTPLAGDSVSVAGTPQATFSDANVAQGKPVSLSGLSLAGTDAGNYTLVTSGLLAANITPASLAYVAAPITLADGDVLPTLQGQVTGFLGGDTLASATTGSASYTSTVQTSTTPSPGRVTATPGAYAVDGSGLSASNYVFTQDPGNAQALTVVAPRRVDTPSSQDTVTTTQTATAAQQPSPSAGKGSVIDLTGLYPTGDAGSLFGATPLGEMSPAAVTALLSSRDAFKQNLLGASLGQLAVRPGLADLPPCQSLKDAVAGTCLVTDTLRRQARAPGTLALQGDAAGSTAPTIASATTIASTTATATATAPATVPVPVPAPATNAPGTAPGSPGTAIASAATPVPATASIATSTTAPLFSFRPVRSATLPQIQHKVAVLIGVDDYQDGSIPHLTHAVGDAQAMGELFAQRLGYDTLTLSSPTRATVVATLNRLALEMGPRDSVLIYYAGHGAVADGEGAGKGEGYWLLGDSQATKPETWLSNADIARLLGVIDAQQVALISDSCYSGTLASGARIAVTPEVGDPGRILARRAEVVMSSGGNEPVFDAGKHGHSPFAWNLLETLGKTSGWTPGGRVFQRVRFEVARELPQHPQYAGATNHQADADYLFEQRQLDGAN